MVDQERLLNSSKNVVILKLTLNSEFPSPIIYGHKRKTTVTHFQISKMHPRLLWKMWYCMRKMWTRVYFQNFGYVTLL